MKNKMNKLIDVYCSIAFHAYTKLCRVGAWFVFAAAVLLTLSATPLSANEPSAPDEIGQVTLVIGQVLAHNTKGNKHSLKRGDSVHVDETIETSEGGHVHLRFIDEGTISLRPNSRLSIELYHYDKQQPKNSAIRFNLEAGVVRSISGKATEAAHDRFRLNTPITAIGVLGTDFVVRAESEKMWAGVYSGAIAIAPLSEQCPANGLGSCGGATRLSEAMGSVMIEFSGRREKEKIVPLDPAILSKANQSDKNNSDQSVATSPVGSGRITVAEMKAIDVTAHLNTTQQPVQQQPSPFAWARQGSQLPGDTMSRPWTEAHEGRSVVAGVAGVGSDPVKQTHLLLFRTPSALTELEPRAGKYDFKPMQGEVYFSGNGASSLPEKALAQLNLNTATLQIDFAQREFNTHLEMSHPQIGSANLDQKGLIQDNGYFVAGVPDVNNVAGTLSLDGAYAGMSFVKKVELGTFTGITDWTKN